MGSVRGKREEKEEEGEGVHVYGVSGGEGVGAREEVGIVVVATVAVVRVMGVRI